ncbi:hypothetical protein [Staphylococcus epidermidis]|uniref:hypothetical protein n=1 Tax=Staphylococcus epidermidis TaxID=1282 RepID=UPI001E426CB9|nr:hypothetical protein [Staphylococcus epidermidis]
MSEKKKMSVTQLTIVTAVNMMGSGIIMLPTNLAQVGTMSILSWIITTIGATMLALYSLELAYIVQKVVEWEDMQNTHLAKLEPSLLITLMDSL